MSGTNEVGKWRMSGFGVRVKKKNNKNTHTGSMHACEDLHIKVGDRGAFVQMSFYHDPFGQLALLNGVRNSFLSAVGDTCYMM